MPCRPGAEPAWFDAAMTRVLVPIQQELLELRQKLDGIEASNARIWRMAAIVESLILLFIPF